MSVTVAKIDFDLAAGRALERALAQLPPRVQRSIVQKAARPALQMIRRDAASRVRSIKVASGVAAQRRDASGRLLSAKELAAQGGPGTRDSIARAMKIATKKPRRGIVGARLRVVYPRRKGNRIEGHQKAAVAHLMEWGFTHIGGAKVAGHLFMTKALDANRSRAVDMIRRAIAALLRDPGIRAKQLRVIARSG